MKVEPGQGFYSISINGQEDAAMQKTIATVLTVSLLLLYNLGACRG
jgi:hypothetical protein